MPRSSARPLRCCCSSTRFGWTSSSTPFFYTPYCIVPLLVPGGLAGRVRSFSARARKDARQVRRFSGVIALLFLPASCRAVPLDRASPRHRRGPRRCCSARRTRKCVSSTSGMPGDQGLHLPRRGGGRPSPVSRPTCAWRRLRARYDRQRVQLRLTGDRTPLGFRITRFEHQGVRGPARPGRRPLASAHGGRRRPAGPGSLTDRHWPPKVGKGTPMHASEQTASSRPARRRPTTSKPSSSAPASPGCWPRSGCARRSATSSCWNATPNSAAPGR